MLSDDFISEDVYVFLFFLKKKGLVKLLFFILLRVDLLEEVEIFEWRLRGEDIFM